MNQANKVPIGLAHTPLRDQIRDEIRQRVIDGRLGPGTRIIERELATELGVSRIPVREAFRMLEIEGFVAVVPRRGVIVRQLSRRDVEQLFDVREALEVLACRRAAERVTKADARRIGQWLARARKAIDSGDRAALGNANDAFHDGIIALADNELLVQMLEPLQGRLHWLFRQLDNPEILHREHVELGEAITSGNRQRATDAALTHVQLNRVRALHFLFEDATETDRVGSEATAI